MAGVCVCVCVLSLFGRVQTLTPRRVLDKSVDPQRPSLHDPPLHDPLRKDPLPEASIPDASA